MRFWVLIPAGFGLWWLIAGFSAIASLTDTIEMGLCAGAAAIAIKGILRGEGGGTASNGTAFRRAFIIEGVGISLVLLVSVILKNTSLIIPLIGTVVGLHFIPLAKVFDDRRFVYSGVAMAFISLLSLLWPAPMRDAVAGIGGGATLWLFALCCVFWPRSRTRPGIGCA